MNWFSFGGELTDGASVSVSGITLSLWAIKMLAFVVLLSNGSTKRTWRLSSSGVSFSPDVRRWDSASVAWFFLSVSTICVWGKNDCGFAERVDTFRHAWYWRWVSFVTALSLRYSTQKRDVPSFFGKKQLVQLITSVWLLWFFETAFFQFRHFQILWHSIQRDMEVNVQFVYFCRGVWYGALLRLCGRGDSPKLIEIGSPYLWTRRGTRIILRKCELLLASTVLNVLTRHVVWHCGATFAILALL